jgi:hypothetical protein
MDWPDGIDERVYIPPAITPVPVTQDDVRVRLVSARVRERLPVDEDTLSQITRAGYAADPDRAGIYTAEERQDIYSDSERVARARAVLADAADVFGDLQVCWLDGRRAVRVLLTGELERYRERLSAAIGSERVLVEQTAFTETELRRRAEEMRAQSERLAADGIQITMSGYTIDGFVIEYLAADFARADRLLHERFGEFATIRYRGASNHTFRPIAFGSWATDGQQLHLFYALPRNAEQPGGAQVFETDTAVIVALWIKDWRGAKTLIGGFTPSHATVQLSAPLGQRDVIDNADNRARPHWTQA